MANDPRRNPEIYRPHFHPGEIVVAGKIFANRGGDAVFPRDGYTGRRGNTPRKYAAFTFRAAFQPDFVSRNPSPRFEHAGVPFLCGEKSLSRSLSHSLFLSADGFRWIKREKMNH